jgi:hypothetical protein
VFFYFDGSYFLYKICSTTIDSRIEGTMKSSTFGDMTPCNLMITLLGLLFELEDGGRMFLRNVG